MTVRQRVAAVYVGVLGVALSGLGGMVLLTSDDHSDFRFDLVIGWMLVLHGGALIASTLLLAAAHAPGLLYGVAMAVGAPNLIAGVPFATHNPWPGLPMLLAVVGLVASGLLVLPDLVERPVESTFVALASIAVALYIAPSGALWGAVLVAGLGVLPWLLRLALSLPRRSTSAVDPGAAPGAGARTAAGETPGSIDEAAERYASAADDFNRTVAARTADLATSSLAEQVRTWSELATTAASFITAVQAIRFPPEVRPKADELLRAAFAFERRALAASKATSPEELAEAGPRASGWEVAVADRSAVLRDALGLPTDGS